MTIALRYAAYSDVGCLREGNEDSAYAGPYLLAVADGMGGHAGGEIASAIAIAALMPLDDDGPGNEMVDALERAVEQSNTQLSERVAEEPQLENMGTTLTAMLWSGARVALLHVGDSRAYLLRDGDFEQVTHDHTLVQTLVDEGKITEDEVATHPQRSLLLRALDGRSRVDPDVSVREARVGDRYLLCSDGLSGVVSAETINDTLANETNPDAVARRLIDLANRGGGPDNITAVVADVIDTATDPRGATTETMLVGAADQRREPAMTPDTPAGRAQELSRSGDTAEMTRIPAFTDGPPPGGTDDDDDDDEPEPRTRRWWPMVVTFLVIVILLAGVGYYFGKQYLDSQYFIGPSTDQQNVAIYQGLSTDVAGYSLAEQIEDSEIPIAMLPENERNLVAKTIAVGGRSEADKRIEDLRGKSEACQAKPQSCGISDSKGGESKEAPSAGSGKADESGASREPAGGQ